MNELIARLTETAVQDKTTTNRTLDRDEETFPLGKGVYADFSHDNEMVSVFAAMRVFEEVGLEEASGVGGWVPFGGRLAVEGLRCGDGGGEEGEMLVRVLVNGRVLPLEWCGGDEMGRCGVGRFVGGLGFAREGGRWGECFEGSSDDDGDSAGGERKGDGA